MLTFLIAETANKKYICDKLFRVNLKNGGDQWILTHVEVQGKKQNIFSERMFKYAYRIYDKYQKPILSLAILTDANHNWRPHSFKVGIGGTYLKSKFLTLKILDYRNQLAELKASKNPFSRVLLAQLSAIDAKKKEDKERKQIKLALIRDLYDIGMNKQDIYNLFKFIDWLIGLPENLGIEYDHEVQQIEGEKKMAYISSFERRAMKKGEKRGIEKEKKSIALILISKGLDQKEIIAITGLTQNEIEALKDKSTTMNKDETESSQAKTETV